MFESQSGGNRRFCNVPQMPQRCVAGVRRMLGIRRYRGLLAVSGRRPKGDTVVSPCDFHSPSPEKPLNKGSPGGFPSRAARPRAHSHTRAGLHKACTGLPGLKSTFLTPKIKQQWKKQN